MLRPLSKIWISEASSDRRVEFTTCLLWSYLWAMGIGGGSSIYTQLDLRLGRLDAQYIHNLMAHKRRRSPARSPTKHPSSKDYMQPANGHLIIHR